MEYSRKSVCEQKSLLFIPIIFIHMRAYECLIDIGYNKNNTIFYKTWANLYFEGKFINYLQETRHGHRIE